MTEELETTAALPGEGETPAETAPPTPQRRAEGTRPEGRPERRPRDDRGRPQRDRRDRGERGERQEGREGRELRDSRDNRQPREPRGQREPRERREPRPPRVPGEPQPAAPVESPAQEPATPVGVLPETAAPGASTMEVAAGAVSVTVTLLSGVSPVLETTIW